MITYKIVKGLYVFCKDGVYFSLNKEQVSEMSDLCTEALVQSTLDEAAKHLPPNTHL